MLRVDQVYIIRHKVLQGGRSIRSVARELGVSRNSVRKYKREPEPVRKSRRPKPRPVTDAVRPRLEALVAAVGEGHEQRVQHALALGLAVPDATEPSEVDLGALAWGALRHAHGEATPLLEATVLGREAMQGAVGDLDPLAGQQDLDLGEPQPPAAALGV